MVMLYLPAAVAASPDWNQLVITVSWTDGMGEAHSVDAVPVTESATGEGCFWIALPPEAPMEALYISAFHPMHEGYQYSLTPESPVIGIADAGLYMDSFSYIPLIVTDPETYLTETFDLYFSTQAATPILENPEEVPP